jgi:hypothetical protein
MRYQIVLASRPITRLPVNELPFIPGTDRVIIFDTALRIYKGILSGYLTMREAQKTQNLDDSDWNKIKVTEEAPEEEQVKEAVNIFMRFLAGTARDNCECVRSIEAIGD